MCVSRPNKILRSRSDVNSSLITDQPFSTPRLTRNTITVQKQSTLSSIKSNQQQNGQQEQEDHRKPLLLEADSPWEKAAMTTHMSYVFKKKVHVWILPLCLSQSKFGGRRKPSSACTIITVQIAHDFLKSHFELPYRNSRTQQSLGVNVMEVMINAIIDGNDTHGKAMTARQNGFVGELTKKDLQSEDLIIDTPFFMCSFLKKPYRDTFTVPEAIRVHRPEMHEIDYRCFVGPFLPNLIRAISGAIQHDYLKHLNRMVFGVLAFERAMSVIYDRPSDTICLIDTHMHFQGRAGSIIASSAFENVNDFLVTIVKCVFPEVFKNQDFHGQFEITCLMLSEIYNKVHRGSIFKMCKEVPIVPRSTLLANLKSRLVVKQNNTNSGDDSGYESNEDVNS